jgi:hypothetical protein
VSEDIDSKKQKGSTVTRKDWEVTDEIIQQLKGWDKLNKPKRYVKTTQGNPVGFGKDCKTG